MSPTTAQAIQPLERPLAKPFGVKLLVGNLGARAWSSVLVLLALCGFLFFYGLSSGEFYRTEGLRAIIAAEFLRSGNWIVPTLYGEPLFTKPPGMYAAIALVSWPVGNVTEWTARLPSALAASVTVFLWFWYFSRQLGRRAGLLAAVILPISLMWLDKASVAEIDMLQVAWVTAALLCFLRALEIAETPSSNEQTIIITARTTLRGTIQSQATHFLNFSHPCSRESAAGGQGVWWLAALLCVAGGVLTKWTAPAFFYATVISLLWWRGRLRLLFGRHHIISAMVGAGVCLLWMGAAVALAGWRPFYDTVSREALMRLLPSHHYRPYPWRETLVHPFKILAANLPWTLAALFTLRPSFAGLWDARGRRLLQAMHCWIWPSLFFWTIIPEHAPRHSFPMFPAISGLAALVWIAWLDGRLHWPLAGWRWLAHVKPAGTLAVILLLWLPTKFFFVHAVVPMRNQDREARSKGRLVAEHVPEGATLYLFRLKDEGIMFYYGRTVRRLPGPDHLHLTNEPLYCIVDEAEWQHWPYPDQTQVVQHLQDEQGAAIMLLKVEP